MDSRQGKSSDMVVNVMSTLDHVSRRTSASGRSSSHTIDVRRDGSSIDARQGGASTASLSSLQRVTSLARALSKPVITGVFDTDPWEPRSRVPSRHQDESGLQDMYIEDLMHSGEKQYKPKKNRNIRASLGFCRLLWYDFKIWYRRWKQQHWEVPLFRSQIRNMETNFGSGIGAVFVFTRWVFCLNSILTLFWLAFVVLPAAILFPYTSVSEFALRNILDGKGLVGSSWVFYGAYRSKLGSYYMSLAYLILVLLTYFGSFFIILRNMGKSYEPKSTVSIKSRFKFSLLMWTSWDHSITSEEAALNLSKGIASALKDNLHEAKASDATNQRSRREKYKVFALRSLAWLITIILIGGGCTGIAYLVIYVNFSGGKSQLNLGSEEDDFLTVYGTTIIFSLVNIFVPLCIGKLPKMEHYTSGKTELNITIARVFLLRMANLFALLSSIYQQVKQVTSGCAGTLIGQEVYKLVLMDTIVHTSIQVIMSFGKFYWTRQKREFNISAAVLVLIYRQALIWVGTLACPVLPLIGLCCNTVSFFLMYGIVSKTCKPPIKRWNQSRNTLYFMTFLMATLALLILPISIVIGSQDVIQLGLTGTPGVFCGPFGGEMASSAYKHFRQSQVPWLQSLLYWLVSDTMLIPFFFLLLSLINYLRNRISGESRQRLVLQAELRQEREENKKLVKKLQDLGINLD